ncbi:MAG: AAA family ATPase [Bacilli bacterium]|nr:AAA family ATPase [Bacilli bacterium]
MGKIIAIVGMCGSGKSVASDYLESIGYKKVYFGGVTMEKLKESNMEINPENEKYMREKLRDELGMAAYAKILLPRIIEYSTTDDVVLDGLYSWDEYVVLKEKLGDKLTMVAIVTDKYLRYDRLTKREIRPLTNEEALKRDIAEIENLAKGGPISIADFYILNNYDKETYINNLKNILDKIN